jgi:SYF2 splicing factor
MSFMVSELFLTVPVSFYNLCLADDAHAARRRYKKDLDLIKPDLVAYNRQKEIAMGLPAGTLVQPASSTVTNFDPKASQMQVLLPVQILNFYIFSSFFFSNQVVPSLHQQQLAAENLYRDANSLLYADNRPTEDAIDRVVSKINREFVRTVACPHGEPELMLSVQHRQERQILPQAAQRR